MSCMQSGVVIGFVSVCALLSAGQSCLGPLTPPPSGNNGNPPPPVVAPCGLAGNSCEAPTGDSPAWVAISDLDGDGDNDMAVANSDGDSVSILINDGMGRFALARTLPAGDSPSSVISADFDRDGRTDLVVGSVQLLWGPGATFLRNLGGAVFAPGTGYSSGSVSSVVVAADLDNNTSLDLITVNRLAGSLSLLSGRGNGTFAAPLIVSAGARPTAVVPADLDGDGDIDLAAADEQTDSVAILRNQGVANFLPPILFRVGSRPQSIAAADLDNDGDLDLVTADQGADSGAVGSISILANNGNATFAAARLIAVGVNPVFVLATDLSGDRRADLAVVNLGSGSQDAGVAILLNTGGGSFTQPVILAAGDRPVMAASGDLDRDGDPDLAVVDSARDRLILLGNLGNGSFARSQ